MNPAPPSPGPAARPARSPRTAVATGQARWAAPVAALALLAAACGATSSGSSRPASAAGPTTSGAPSTTAAPASSTTAGGLASLGPLQPAPPQGGPGPEVVPVPDAPALAGLGTAATGQPVDGITCDTSEGSVFHIHVHLTVFVDGAQRQVPGGIGIPNPQAQQTASGPFVDGGSCLYWLHTHAGDGIVHIEAPKQVTFTLGQFFDIWGQPLSTGQVGPATGPVTVLVDGQPYGGDPRAIPFAEHRQIQLEVGSPLVAPVTVTNWGGL